MGQTRHRLCQPFEDARPLSEPRQHHHPEQEEQNVCGLVENLQCIRWRDSAEQQHGHSTKCRWPRLANTPGLQDDSDQGRHDNSEDRPLHPRALSCLKHHHADDAMRGLNRMFPGFSRVADVFPRTVMAVAELAVAL